MSPLNITQPLGVWSIMATIRWCPIFPKWDSYQPLTIGDGHHKKRWRLALPRENHDVTLEQAQMATVFRWCFFLQIGHQNIMSCPVWLRNDEKCIASYSPHLLLASYVRPTPKPKHQYRFIAAGSIHADTDIDNRYWILDKGMCVYLYI